MATLQIDDAFIGEWHPKYSEKDESEYIRLVRVVAQDMAIVGTISQQTFKAIWKWKGAIRKIGLVNLGQYDTLYAEAFRRAAAASPAQKLAELLAPNLKLPGVGAPSGSTIIHFIHPQTMPIIDVRTVGVLHKMRLIKTKQTDFEHYEVFRQAMDKIRQGLPCWTLREIDRALFAYHKRVLDTKADPLRKGKRAPRCVST